MQLFALTLVELFEALEIRMKSFPQREMRGKNQYEVSREFTDIDVSIFLAFLVLFCIGKSKLLSQWKSEP